MTGSAGKMTEKKLPGFNGTVMVDETTPPPRTRPSLFPTREQVASFAGLPMPQPRAVVQPPQPDMATTAQEAVSDVDTAELHDFELADAPSPLESAPVDSDNERKSSRPDKKSQSHIDTSKASRPLAAKIAPQSSSFPLLRLPPRAIHRTLDLLLVYDEPIALVRKRPDRRLVEANKSHILTVGKGKTTREPQNKAMKSNVARTINTASPTNLFLVCRALRNLGIKTYYNKNTFAFYDRQGLTGWAASIGSRRNEVRKVELRSEWEVVFKNNDIHSKYLGMTADKAVLSTTELRVLRNIARVNIDIALRMPWQRTGKLPDYDKVSLDAQKMCFKFGKLLARDMAFKFMIHELNTPLIAKHLHIWFDKTWQEPWYESAEFKRRDVEDKRKLATERAAKASSGEDS
jgi:hypothetical protein